MLRVLGHELRGAIALADLKVWHRDGARAARELLTRTRETGLVRALGTLAEIDRVRAERRGGGSRSLQPRDAGPCASKTRVGAPPIKNGFLGMTHDE